jgi:methionyl-tRNA synthetase
VVGVPLFRYPAGMSNSDGAAGGTAPAPSPNQPVANPFLAIEDFQKVELKAGRVVAAEPHPSADRLLVLQVELGEEKPRQIVAGIRAHWAPEALVGRTIIVVANLKPAMLRGVESRGMLLAVRGVEKVIPLGLEGDVIPGTRVT